MDIGLQPPTGFSGLALGRPEQETARAAEAFGPVKISRGAPIEAGGVTFPALPKLIGGTDFKFIPETQLARRSRLNGCPLCARLRCHREVVGRPVDVPSDEPRLPVGLSGSQEVVLLRREWQARRRTVAFRRGAPVVSRLLRPGDGPGRLVHRRSLPDEAEERSDRCLRGSSASRPHPPGDRRGRSAAARCRISMDGIAQALTSRTRYFGAGPCGTCCRVRERVEEGAREGFERIVSLLGQGTELAIRAAALRAPTVHWLIMHR